MFSRFCHPRLILLFSVVNIFHPNDQSVTEEKPFSAVVTVAVVVGMVAVFVVVVAINSVVSPEVLVANSSNPVSKLFSIVSNQLTFKSFLLEFPENNISPQFPNSLDSKKLND